MNRNALDLPRRDIVSKNALDISDLSIGCKEKTIGERKLNLTWITYHTRGLDKCPTVVSRFNDKDVRI